MRTVLCLAATAVMLGFGGNAHAQIIAMSGFNDQTGINSNPTPNSPFNVNNTQIAGQGVGESGWLSPWQQGANPATVVNTGQAEGDGAVRIQDTGGIGRILASPLAGVVRIEHQFTMASSVVVGQGVNHVVLQTTNAAIGPLWQASADGRWRVVDGVEDDVGTLETTPFTWTPGVFQTIRVDINVVDRTWQFFVNGARYNSPDPLGFRGSPVFLDQFNVMNFTSGSNTPFIDAVIVTQLPIPEPSSLALAGLAAAAGIAGWRRKRGIFPA